MDEIWKDREKFKEIMMLTTVPYQNFMFDDREMKVKCWQDLINQWNIVKKFYEIEGHPSDVDITEGIHQSVYK